MKNIIIQQSISKFNSRLLTLLIYTSLILITACTDQHQPVQPDEVSTSEAVGLFDHIWQVEDIDNAGIIDRSYISMELTGEGGLAGSTGCNQYFGSVAIEEMTFKVDQVGSTRKACVPALMQQEQKFLQALDGVRAYEIKADFLNLYDKFGTTTVRLIRTEEQTRVMPNSTPQDKSGTENQVTHKFSCGNKITFEFYFIGPETLQANMGDDKYILQRDSAASGAKYMGSGILFWNKGAEALLELEGRKYNCKEQA